LRISLIAPCWYPVPPPGYGGIELVVGLLADGLVACGHDVTLYAPKGSSSKARVVSPAAPPDPATVGNSWYETTHALAAYLESSSFDLVHDHSGIVGPALGAVRSGPPIVHTLHGPWTEPARGFYRVLHRLVGLVAISDAQRIANPYVSYAGMVHNGIDLDAYPFVEKKGDHLIFVGRANPDKNPVGAIKVARRAGYPLTMIVKRNERAEHAYWEAEVAPLLGSDVDVRTDVSHAEKVHLLGTARAMVFPIQWDEPFGLVMTEAMACGTPVIATARGAAVEVIDHGRTGFLCNTVDSMAGAVERAGNLSPADCRQRVALQFSAEAMVEGYERIYQRVVGVGDAGTHPSIRGNGHRHGGGRDPLGALGSVNGSSITS
jgi:glycosyltransferase involved in cell wall biosynthesis